MTVGCGDDAYRVFNGTITAADRPAFSGELPVSGQFSAGTEDRQNWLVGYILSNGEGELVFAHDRRPEPGVDKLAEKSELTAVYYAKAGAMTYAHWSAFVNDDPALRAENPWVHQLHGWVYIEQAESKTDKTIHVALYDPDAPYRKIDGVLLDGRRQSHNVLETLVWVAFPITGFFMTDNSADQHIGIGAAMDVADAGLTRWSKKQSVVPPGAAANAEAK